MTRFFYLAEREIRIPLTVVIFALLFLNLLGLVSTITGTTMSINDSLWRTFVAGICVLVLPGAAINIRFLSNQGPFHAFGKWFCASLIFGCALAIFCFIFHLSIGSWVAMTLIWNTTGLLLALLYYPKRSTYAFRFPVSELLLMTMVCLLSAVLFLQADDIRQVDWEVALHINYVRHYASELPLDFRYSNLRPGSLAPGNHFFLWEFELAAISKIAGVDSLIAALRTRWAIPLLGFSALSLFARSLTQSRWETRLIVWIAVILSFWQFQTILPFRWDGAVVRGPYRGLLLFMGSIHHADTAMELLLPLELAAFFSLLWRPTWKRASLFVSMLILSFFWHPREYFQVAWIVAIALFVFGTVSIIQRRGARFRRIIVATMACLAVTTLILLLFTHAVVHGNKEQSEAFDAKSLVGAHVLEKLQNPAFYFSVQPPFHYQEAFAPEPQDPLTGSSFSWLVLSSLLLPFLLLTKRSNSIWLAGTYLLLWWLTLCYLPSQWLLTLGTYNEILMSKSRFMFPFFLVVIGLAWIRIVSLVQRLGRNGRQAVRMVMAAGFFIFSGLAFHFVYQKHSQYPQAWMSAWFCFTSVATLIQIFRVSRVPSRESRALRASADLKWTVLSFMLFASVPSWQSARHFWFSSVHETRRLDVLFNDGNVVGVSGSLISYLRREVPPRSYIQVEPGRARMIGVYAPLYVKPLSGYVLKDIPEHDLIHAKQHPVYSPDMLSIENLPRIKEFLQSGQINYLLGEGGMFEKFKGLAGLAPQQFEIAFENDMTREILLKFKAR